MQTYIGLLTMYYVHSWTIPYLHTIFTQLDSASTQLLRGAADEGWMWWFLQAQWCSSIRGCCTERDAINTAHAPGIPCALEMGSGCVHMVLFMFYTYFIHLYSMNGSIKGSIKGYWLLMVLLKVVLKVLLMVLLKVLLMVLLMFTWCVLYVCWILVFVVCPLLSLWFLLDLSRIILCLCPNMKKIHVTK